MKKIHCKGVGDNDGYFEFTPKQRPHAKQQRKLLLTVLNVIENSQSLSLDNQADRFLLKNKIIDAVEDLNENN